MNTGAVYGITALFEQSLCDYTNAKYCVVVDNCSNALFLCLELLGVRGQQISIPNRTYPSVPCSIVTAGGKVKFEEVIGTTIKGKYNLKPTNIWDSSLSFTKDMYVPGTLMCLSFSGAYKHLKLGKGGAILLDNEWQYKWLKKARFSGRNECSYHEDTFDMIGWNFYMLPEIAARGLLLMNQFYDNQGNKKHNDDIELPFPDLSQFSIYSQ